VHRDVLTAGVGATAFGGAVLGGVDATVVRAEGEDAEVIGARRRDRCTEEAQSEQDDRAKRT
jgi:hypothetical protein